MTEKEYLKFCKKQITGPMSEEDIITMLTAWGAINYSLGHRTALKEHNITVKGEDQANLSPDPSNT